MIRKRISTAHAYITGEGLGPMLVRSVAGTAVVRLAAMGASFLVGVQLARMLGVKGYGYYGLALSIVTLAGIPGELGLPKLVTREVASAASRKDWAHLFGVLRWARRTALIMSAVTAVLAFIIALIFMELRNPSGLARAVLFGAPVIPLMALSRVEGGATQGLHQIVRGQIPANLFRPLLLSAMLFAAGLLHLRIRPGEAMALNSVTAAAAFILAYLWLKKLLPPAVPAEVRHAGRRWLGSSIPMAFTDGMRALQSELSTLFLGVIAGPGQVGLFRVASATAMMAAVVIVIVGNATMPTIARLFAEHDIKRLARVATSSARVQFAGVLLLCLPLLFGGGPLLGFVFGEAFARGGAPLKIIALAQLANAAFGVNVLLLNMTHHERRVMRAMGFALVINLVSLALLGHFWGATGAAIAFAIAILCWNVQCWFDARRLVGIDTSILGLVPRFPTTA